ncbi:MAG: orotidine 5'-phosphate decarboxylase, partial [Patescibacteria group bacterium]|nr:orotidine 5'-phosphate decarboxylase [Patescibacteria group bacterium]
ETVKKAVGQAMRLKPKFLNLHANGGKKMMLAAYEAREKFLAEHPSPDGHRPKLLAVTVLTSLNYRDFEDDGVFDPVEKRFEIDLTIPNVDILREKQEIERVVVRRAENALECGLDGVIASAQEAAAIRKACGPDFLIVTPAIRPLWAAVGDQKRPTTPSDAIKAGADYLVIGRPILKPPAEVGSTEHAVKLICEEIEQVTA